MKKFAAIILAVMLAITLFACSSYKSDNLSSPTVTAGSDFLSASPTIARGNTAEEAPTTYVTITADPPAESNIQSEAESNIQSEEKAIGLLNIKVGNKNFTAVLYDNATTQALLAQLPLTLDMSELNGNEKYCRLPDSMPADDENVESVIAGDLMLYGSDYLVLFYKSFSTSYRYTRIGFVEDVSGLAEALGSGGIQVEISVDGETD